MFTILHKVKTPVLAGISRCFWLETRAEWRSMYFLYLKNAAINRMLLPLSPMSPLNSIDDPDTRQLKQRILSHPSRRTARERAFLRWSWPEVMVNSHVPPRNITPHARVRLRPVNLHRSNANKTAINKNKPRAVHRPLSPQKNVYYRLHHAPLLPQT